MLFCKQSSELSMRQKCFMHAFQFITQNIKRWVSQELRFNKANHFCCFIKDILEWNWIRTTTSNSLGSPPLFTTRCRQFSSPLPLHHPSVPMSRVKGQVKSSIIMKIVLTSRISWKGLKETQVVRRALFEKYWITSTQSNTGEP